MATRLYTREEIMKAHVERARVNRVVYDYSNVFESRKTDKIKIVCPEHGLFVQAVYKHMNGQGCKQCSLEHVIANRGGDKQKRFDDFIKTAKKVHGERFSYSATEQTFEFKNKECVIHCNTHNIDFNVKPNAHLRNVTTGGCPKCLNENRKERLKYDTLGFVDKAKNKYGDVYSYERTKYMSRDTPVIITCKKHGDFRITPHRFLSERLKLACPICVRERFNNERRKTTDDFIKEASEKHHGTYDYALVQYTTAYDKVRIICHEKFANGSEHGIFWQTPHNHLHGQGCPKCKKWKLETEVMESLIEKGIEFEHQKTFKWLGKQSIDVFIPDYNIAIECQGLQHFSPVDFSKCGNNDIEESHKRSIARDERKYDLCRKHKIVILYYTKTEYAHYMEGSGRIFFTNTEDLCDYIKKINNDKL